MFKNKDGRSNMVEEKWKKISNFDPPYCIRNFEFLNVELGLVISDAKNLRVPNIFPIK